METFVHTGDSANISWYAEKSKRGKYIYVEVLCDSVHRVNEVMMPRLVPVFYFRISQAGTGRIGEFTYRPRRRPDPIPLTETLVTQLVRKRFIPAEDISSSEDPGYAGDGVIADND